MMASAVTRVKTLAVPNVRTAMGDELGGGPSALAPLTDLLGVLAVVPRRDAIHEPRRRPALGELLVGQA